MLDNDLKPSVRVTVTLPLELAVERTAPLTVGTDMDLDEPHDSLAPKGPVAVAGRVVRDGAGVGGVRIRIGGASAMTRQDGTFELRAVYPGVQEVLLAHDGEFIELEAEVTGEGELTLELPATATSGRRRSRRSGDDSARRRRIATAPDIRADSEHREGSMATYQAPGVYVEEVPSGSRPIEAIGTAVAAFVGFTEKGPVGTPVRVTN